MTRGGRETGRTAPERRCIATRQVRPAAEMFRFAVGPDGQIVPDILGRLPGRGIWVSADAQALTRAVEKGLFARAAEGAVTVPADLLARTEALQAAHVIALLSMARKAGDAIVGYEKVKDWLQKGRAAVLIQASDGSARGKQKLRPPPGSGSFIGCLRAQEMGLAFAREHAIHGALAAGGLAQRISAEAAKLASLRERNGGSPAAGKDTKDA